MANKLRSVIEESDKILARLRSVYFNRGSDKYDANTDTYWGIPREMFLERDSTSWYYQHLNAIGKHEEAKKIFDPCNLGKGELAVIQEKMVQKRFGYLYPELKQAREELSTYLTQ